MSQLTQRLRGAEERRGGSDVVEKPVAVANSGQWPSGVQRVHSGLVLVLVVVSSMARCGVAPAASTTGAGGVKSTRYSLILVLFVKQTCCLVNTRIRHNTDT